MEQLNIPGLGNAYKVDGLLWRSAQPSDAAFPLIKAAGGRFIMDLNNSGAEATRQAALATAAGLQSCFLDWNGELAPSLATIRTAIGWMKEAVQGGNSPVLVHCKHGSDRTGTFCACWRLENKECSIDKAVEEAIFDLGLGGMHEVWMALAIRAYGKSLGL